MVLGARALPAVCLARVAAHWLVTGVPLLVIAPLVAMMYGIEWEVLIVLVAGLLLGTPLLSMIGAVAAALTVSLKRSAPLLALLVLPLCVPVLIFGTRAASMAASGLAVEGPLYLLAALLVLAVTLAPFAIAAALRINLE